MTKNQIKRGGCIALRRIFDIVPPFQFVTSAAKIEKLNRLSNGVASERLRPSAVLLPPFTQDIIHQARTYAKQLLDAADALERLMEAQQLDRIGRKKNKEKE